MLKTRTYDTCSVKSPTLNTYKVLRVYFEEIASEMPRGEKNPRDRGAIRVSHVVAASVYLYVSEHVRGTVYKHVSMTISQGRRGFGARARG